MPDHRPADVSDALARRRELEALPVREAGGGVAEGFELAETLLVEHATHGDSHSTHPIMRDAGHVDEEHAALSPDVYGEADSEHGQGRDRADGR